MKEKISLFWDQYNLYILLGILVLILLSFLYVRARVMRNEGGYMPPPPRRPKTKRPSKFRLWRAECWSRVCAWWNEISIIGYIIPIIVILVIIWLFWSGISSATSSININWWWVILVAAVIILIIIYRNFKDKITLPAWMKKSDDKAAPSKAISDGNAKSIGKWIFRIVVLLLIVRIGAYWYDHHSSEKTGTPRREFPTIPKVYSKDPNDFQIYPGYLHAGENQMEPNVEYNLTKQDYKDYSFYYKGKYCRVVSLSVNGNDNSYISGRVDTTGFHKITSSDTPPSEAGLYKVKIDSSATIIMVITKH